MRAVILSNEKGAPQGKADILEAHSGAGKLHLAFSVFVFRNGQSEILLQKRSDQKMLWPGYWSNTCCSHPQEEGETLVEVAMRRLREECGFTCPLKVKGSFVYRAQDPGGRGVEHEYDTVLIGEVAEDVALHPNPDEVSELRWMRVDTLAQELLLNPETYTPWLKKGLEIIMKVQ